MSPCIQIFEFLGTVYVALITHVERTVCTL